MNYYYNYYYHYYYRYYYNPKQDFNRNAPTYIELNRIIWKMKTASATCPLDQISIITLKRCPYLLSYLLEMIKTAWKANSHLLIGSKQLIHKKARMMVLKISDRSLNSVFS